MFHPNHAFDIEKLDPLFVLKEHLKVIKGNILNYSPKKSVFSIEDDSLILKKNQEYYLYTEELAQKINKDSTLLIGESVARCYGYDPNLNFKKILQEPSLIDCSKIGLSLFELFDTLSIARQIKPKKILFMFGNNKLEFNFFNKYVVDNLRGKFGEPYLVLEKLLYHFYYMPVVNKIESLLKDIDIELQFCIPMGNKYSKLLEGETEEYKNNICFTSERALPGIGDTHISAFEKALTQRGYKYISFRSFLFDDTDFIDYCHLSLSGIQKVTGELNRKFGWRGDITIDVDDEMPKKVTDFFHLYVNPHYKELNTDIFQLFNGKPLAYNSKYWEMLNNLKFKKCFGFLNPKHTLPTALMNTQTLKSNNNLLSEVYSANFNKASFKSSLSSQAFPEITDKRSCVYFCSNKRSSFLEASFIPYISDLKVTLVVNNDYTIKLKENKCSQEIPLKFGENKIEIVVENKKIEFSEKRIVQFILFHETSIPLFRLEKLSLS